MLALALAVCAQAAEFSNFGFRFRCSRDLIPAKSFRPGTADYMWPSLAGPKLNLVLHCASQEASFEEELDFAFGEKLEPRWVKHPKGWSHAGGPGFRAAFVHTKAGRVFVGLRTRSQPPLSDRELQKTMLEIVRSLMD